MTPRLPSLELPPGIDDVSVFRSLFIAYPDALLLVDAVGVIVLANPAASQLLGYAPDELAGLPVDALVPDALRARHAAHRAAYGHAPRVRPMGTQMELIARRKDGSEVTVEIALSPLHEYGLPFVVTAIRDIAEYPRVRQALKRARYAEQVAQCSRFAVDTRSPGLLLRHVPEVAAATLDADAAVVYLLEPDRQALRVASGVGLQPEPVGSTVPNNGAHSAGYAIASGAPVVVENYRNEQRFTVPQPIVDAGFVSGLVVPLSDRGIAVGSLAVQSRRSLRFGSDETTFMQSLANLLASSLQRVQTEAALDHAHRLESVGKLTGGIAHDFNNLLTVVQGNLQVLEEHPTVASDPDALERVAAAARASRRGAELTGKLLAFARRQVLKPSRIDVRQMLASLVDMLRRTLDQHIAIEVDIDGSPAAKADAGQLEAALLNVAINASDAMPDGGRLRFRCAIAQSLPPGVESALGPQESDPHDYVSIEVSDTGHGMPDAVKQRAFEPFFTTKASGRGTGLGLSTVYGFVKQSKGAVALDSTIGVGTTITLYLPRDLDDARLVDTDEVASGRIPAGLRVLLVEDEPAVRTVVRAFLVALGCDVTACISAEQALQAIGSLDPLARFDLLLSDVALGSGMRGTELANRVAEASPSTAVLLMSGFSSELLEDQARSPTTGGLLLKPFSRQDLARAIAKAIGA